MVAVWNWFAHLNEEELGTLGHSATLICVFFSARIAFTFLHYHPRMFTVMALFTGVWMCVTGAYIFPKEPRLADLITDVSSFLEVYIGGLLLFEGSRHMPS